MKKFKKLILILLSVLFVLGVFSGCGEEKSFAWGFEHKRGLFVTGKKPSMSHCAVSGDSRTFDKNNVTFNLHYGSAWINEDAELEGFHIVVRYATKIYENFSGLNEYERKILKTVEGNILSEKYRVTYEKKRRKTRYYFSHSEPITIPTEVFDCGEMFGISILAYDSEGKGQEISADKLPQGVLWNSGCYITFEVKGDKVIFTDYSPKEYK